MLEYYAKVLLTETAYVPAKEEQKEAEEAVVMVKRRLSLLRVMPVCKTRLVVRSQLRRSV